VDLNGYSLLARLVKLYPFATSLPLEVLEISFIAMSQCSNFQYMTQDQVRELRGLNTSKIPASHYSQPVTYASGFSANRPFAAKEIARTRERRKAQAKF